ncbi:MAG: hypothetical protein RSA23_09560, partial [Carnobacterium sp.]
MKILICEDTDEKFNQIEDQIKNNSNEFLLIRSSNLIDFATKINNEIYDLIILDLFIPRNNNPEEEALDCSELLVEIISNSKNNKTDCLAITAQAYSNIDYAEKINSIGITIISTSENNLSWKDLVVSKLEKIKTNKKYDFLIFCALEKERDAFSSADIDISSNEIINNLNCTTIHIGKYKGILITPSKPGLVDMAICCAIAIDSFQPKFVFMAGICGGIENESNMLDLVVGSICWEWQTGKFKNNEFSNEPYQVPLDHEIDTELKIFIKKLDLDVIKKGIYSEPLQTSKAKLAPFVSGSSVVSSTDILSAIIDPQHRKIAALDMEMFSMYEASRQSTVHPNFFGVKSVVDFANSEKNDKYHHAGCILSARFIVEFIKEKGGKFL